ncbi:DUF2254 family protein [Streptomyces sp. NPDC048507]|uniref:DUF2254 family protein n=1 Tax=Streptomyces sp. NPDC048507 TaxID=3365560 RepID=UPI00371269DC
MTGSAERRAPGTVFRRPRRAMRRDLSQLVCAALGLVLGLLVPVLRAGPQIDAGRVATLLFTLGFGVISLVSIIYSMLFLVVQFSASAFTPRLGLFRDEPVVWRTFALTVGVFVFCVSSGLSIGARSSVSALVPAVAMVSTLVALAMMRTLQMRAFDSIQLAHSLTAVARRGHRLFDALYADPYDPDRAAAAPPPAAPAPGGAAPAAAVRWTGPAAVLQQVDVAALVALAERHDCAILLRTAPGRPLARDAVLAELTGAGPAAGTGPAAAQVCAALVTGIERTFEQDPELPFRLLSDIALRALSPAVNDPATAVDSMDRTQDLLGRLADRDLAIGRFHDGSGRLRVTVPVPDWERYVRTAVDELAFAAAGSPMALGRLRGLLGALLERCPEDRREVVRERLRWVERTGTQRYPLIWPAAPAAKGDAP